MMRYWFDGVDEGLEREAERSRKLGLPPPDTEPSFWQLPCFRAGGHTSYIVARAGWRIHDLAD